MRTNGRWVGQMPTKYLDDQHIHADGKRHFRSFAEGRRLWMSETSGEYKTLMKLRESLPEEGFHEPLLLSVWKESGKVCMSDGHHRALMCLELGIPRFPFQWHWVERGGIHIQTEPFPWHVFSEDVQRPARRRVQAWPPTGT